MADYTDKKVQDGLQMALDELKKLEHADSSRLGPMGRDDDWRYRASLARVEATQACMATITLLMERGPRAERCVTEGFTVEVFGDDGWQRHANDGRVAFAASDGRRFLLRELNGSLMLKSEDGEMLLHPISRTQVGIENPTT